MASFAAVLSVASDITALIEEPLILKNYPKTNVVGWALPTLPVTAFIEELLILNPLAQDQKETTSEGRLKVLCCF